MLKGDLASFSLGEIFQSLAINNHTGTLKLVAANQPPKLIYFDRGEIRLFSDGSADVPRIGEIFLRNGKITQEDIADSLEEQKRTKQVLGEILVRKGLITPDDIRQALETQVREELYDLFLLRQGNFEFHMGYFPEELSNSLQRKAGISLNTNSVIMEGLRRLDEWAVIQKTIPTWNEIYVRAEADDVETTDKVEAELVAQLDGTRPVKDLFKDFPGTKFDCSKLLCDLLDRKVIRPLTVDELRRAAAEAMSRKAYPQGAAYFLYATELHPESPALHCELGRAFAAFHQEKSAKEAYLKAFRIYFESGESLAAIDTGEKVMAMGSLGEEDLERLFESYLQLKKLKKATSAGHQLVTLLQKKGDVEKAADILGTLANFDPSDLNLKIQVATLFEKAGDKKRATEYLEDVGESLEKARKHRELLKILRLIVEMNPESEEARARLTAIQDLIVRMEKRRKQRVKLVGATSVAALLFIGVPFLYEVKAREFLSHAQRLEQISLVSMDFKKAREAYEKLVASYGFSTKVAEAQEALDRISAIERTFLERHEKETEKQKMENEKRLAVMKDQLAAALVEAEAAERDGDLAKAHEVLRRVSKDYSELLATRNILWPLQVTSEPSGATLSVSGNEIGKTPVILRFKPGTTVTISVEKKSCESVHKSVTLGSNWSLHFDLRRKPTGDFLVAPAIHQPMMASGGRIIFPSRDGHVYAVDPVRKITHWQRVVGRYGDRVSSLTVSGEEIYVGNVIGEVTAMSAHTGKSRWVARVGASVLAAPAISRDLKWVAAATTAGVVALINNETGSIVARLTTENEIVARPLFIGEMIVAGSTDNHVYGWSVTRKEPVFARELSDDIVADPVTDGSSLFAATVDGKVHCIEIASRGIIWARSLAPGAASMLHKEPECLLVTTSSGKLLSLHPGTGETIWELTLGKGAVAGFAVQGQMLYATLESGQLTAVGLRDRKLAWEYQCDNPFLAPPCILGDHLFVGTATGKLQFVEVGE